MTSKERKVLRGMANTLQPIFQIGKGGINDNLLSDLNDVLEAKELIKISVLNSCESGAKFLVNELASKLNAEPISAIGNKIVLYRYSSKDGVKHIEI